QLNFCDGEKYKGILQDLGYELTDIPEEADVILFNACAVRAHAESRVIGRLGALKAIKEKNPRLIVGLCGCMAEEEEVRALLRKSYPFVKLVLGAGAMERLPESLLAVYRSGKHCETLQFAGLPDESLPTVRDSAFQASVPVMYGCNNFCTYCIVPYVRGRERSRTPEAIEQEVRELIAQGCKEILLLGQNVNSYGRGLKTEISFPELLRRLDAIEGDYFIRFMSSHPKDATPELIDTMLQSEHIEHHLHLTVQSGSNRVLQ
ncbi:MAG: MiaB/RimO family radical SAM methylthiotransferase, partial [Oscillospiraceae bacterium]|nr:MiaB/RimO family radical SAM methylthiotransferase [Oscillospiraceae bacterium]